MSKSKILNEEENKEEKENVSLELIMFGSMQACWGLIILSSTLNKFFIYLSNFYKLICFQQLTAKLTAENDFIIGRPYSSHLVKT